MLANSRAFTSIANLLKKLFATTSKRASLSIWWRRETANGNALVY